MNDVKKLVDVVGSISIEMTKLYIKSLAGDDVAKPEASHPTSPTPPFKLEDCTDYEYGRDLSSIVEVWTTFAKIDWFNSKSRDDVELIKANGPPALKRLMSVALRDTNQSRHVAGFLLNLYNGERFHFDLSDLGCIDHELFLDCITVLMLNVVQGPEIHTYFERGNKIFEGIAKEHGFRDYSKNP